MGASSAIGMSVAGCVHQQTAASYTNTHSHTQGSGHSHLQVCVSPTNKHRSEDIFPAYVYIHVQSESQGAYRPCHPRECYVRTGGNWILGIALKYILTVVTKMVTN